MSVLPQDPRAQPPVALRVLFKQWQKANQDEITAQPDILDTSSLLLDDRVERLDMTNEQVKNVSNGLNRFLQNSCPQPDSISANYYELKALPGLIVVPCLLPAIVQLSLLDRLLHRDLSNPDHTTNLDIHYDIPELAPGHEVNEQSCISWFDLDQQYQLEPKDPGVHKSLTMKQVLEKKLRWVTLGGQYDWTNKVYPHEKPPAFPQDIADLVRSVFAGIEPQAAILNFYSPGDTLSLHRDVSEECARGLVSISIGCDALFLVANADASQSTVIRLRSGDAILMSGKSRYAWHAVPKVLAGTCNPELSNWPAEQSDRYASWRGWLANRRINLNVRQMREESYHYESSH